MHGDDVEQLLVGLRRQLGALLDDEDHRYAPIEDWSAWLVLADWLTSRGDTRGQLIVLEHRLQTQELTASEERSLRQQGEAIVAAGQPVWEQGLLLPTEAHPRRMFGFVSGILWEHGTWERGSLAHLEAIAAHPGAALLHFLVLRGDVGAAGAVALASSEALRGLTTLWLEDSDIGAEGARAIAASEVLRGLTTLWLEGNGIGDEGAIALATSEHLRALTALDVRDNNIGAEGVRAIAASEALRGLTTLNLSHNDIGAEGARAIAASEALRGLTDLWLEGNNIGDEGAIALANAEALRDLPFIDLADNNIGDEGRAALEGSEVLCGEVLIA